MKSPHLTATLLAAADSHQPILMSSLELQEQKNDSQHAATPLADAADSKQAILMSIPELQAEKNGTQHAATPLASDADSRQPGSVSNHGIEEEKKGKDSQVPAMHLAAAAGSHQLISGLESIIELELPSEGSVLVVDSSRVPADAQEVSRIELKKLVNNDSIKISFRTSNPD